MDYVSKNDFYEIRVASLITNMDRDSLLELYQPIIGAKATSLYLTLSTQNKSKDGTNNFKTEQLLKSMQLTAGEFYSARRYLEAVGLIRSYESKAEDVRCYIYVIYSPKSPKAFFEDVLFKGLLILSVGEKEAKRLANKWKVNLTIPEEYHEASNYHTEKIVSDIEKIFADKCDVVICDSDNLINHFKQKYPESKAEYLVVK